MLFTEALTVLHDDAGEVGLGISGALRRLWSVNGGKYPGAPKLT
jgi:hypothetical protein